MTMRVPVAKKKKKKVTTAMTAVRISITTAMVSPTTNVYGYETLNGIRRDWHSLVCLPIMAMALSRLLQMRRMEMEIKRRNEGNS